MRQSRIFSRSLVPLLAGAAFLTADSLPAGDSPLLPASELATSPSDTSLDQWWNLATLYKNDANPILEEFKLRGRYQGQYHWLESNRGDEQDWENRRSRFGFDAKFFDRKLELRLDAQGNDRFDPLYDSLVDAYLKWKASPEWNLTVGRQKPQIGAYDWLQSTNEQPTFERSQIFNQLRVDRTSGVVATGQKGSWTWQAGLYSNEIDREFGGFDAGLAYGAGLGYDLHEAWDLDKALLRIDWLHSDIEAESNVLNRYANLFSATLWLAHDRYELVGEAFAGTGISADVAGFFLQPSYDLIPDVLQLVGRYSLAVGDAPDALAGQSRYEARAPELASGARGETYHSVYLGLQYFLHGDQLKLLAGAEYADLSGGDPANDLQGWTYLTGIRFSF